MQGHLIPGSGQSQQNINAAERFSTQVTAKPFVKTNGKYSAYRGRYYEKARTSTFYRKYSSRELTQKHRGKAKQLLMTLWWKMIQAPDMEYGTQLTIEQIRILSGENISKRHIKEMLGRFVARGEISIRDPKRTSRYLNSAPYYSMGKDSPYFAVLERVKQSIPLPQLISKKVFTQLLLYICDINSKVVASTQIDASTKLKQNVTTSNALRTKAASSQVGAGTKKIHEKKKRERESMSYTLKHVFLKPEDEKKVLCFPQEALLWADAEMPKYKSNQAPIDLFRNLCKRYCIQHKIRYEEAPTFKDPTTVNTKKGGHKSPTRNTQSQLTKSLHPPHSNPRINGTNPNSQYKPLEELPALTWDEAIKEISMLEANANSTGGLFLRKILGEDVYRNALYTQYQRVLSRVVNISEILNRADTVVDKELINRVKNFINRNDNSADEWVFGINDIANLVETKKGQEIFKELQRERELAQTHIEDLAYDPNTYEDDDSIPLDVLEEFKREGKVSI